MAYDHRTFILNIYDAVADPSRWQSVLDRFAERVNAKGCVVFEWDGHGADRKLIAPYYSSYFDPAALTTYLDRCFEHEAEDQNTFEAHSLHADAVDLIDDRVIEPDLAALKRRRNVEILQKFGILHRAAGLLNKDNRDRARFSVQFDVGRGPPTDKERTTMGLLLPHIAKAMDLGRPADQLALRHQSLLAAMDRLTVGVCILDAGGRMVLCNEEFRRQMDAYATLRTTPDGRLRFARSADQARFDDLRSNALKHGQFGARPRKEAIATETESFLCIEVAPLDHSDEMGTDRFGGAILFSTDTSLPIHCNTEPMQHVFGLTQTELSIMDSIAEGLTNARIAEMRGRSIDTVNAQVKSILSKTNCQTRTQIVRLMMSFGTSFLRPPEASAD